jgi:hypothetical protein
VARAHLQAVQRLPGVIQTRARHEVAGVAIHLVEAPVVEERPSELVVEVARVAVRQAQVVEVQPDQVEAEAADVTNH